MDQPITPFDLQRMFLGDYSWLFYAEVAVRIVIIYGWTLLLIRWIGGRGVAQLAERADGRFIVRPFTRHVAQHHLFVVQDGHSFSLRTGREVRRAAPASRLLSKPAREQGARSRYTGAKQVPCSLSVCSLLPLY